VTGVVKRSVHTAPKLLGLQISDGQLVMFLYNVISSKTAGFTAPELLLNANADAMAIMKVNANKMFFIICLFKNY